MNEQLPTNSRGESRREFIKQATTATAIASAATVALTAQGQSSVESVTRADANEGPWIPPATPPSLGSTSPNGLLLGRVRPVDLEDLPPNALIPHHLATLASAQNVLNKSVSSLTDEESHRLEGQVAESHRQMRDIFHWILAESGRLVAALNKGVIAANTGQGNAAYDEARTAYVDFLASKAGYDQAITSLSIRPAYVHRSSTGDAAVTLGIWVDVKWANPHSSSSGIPIPHA